MFKNEVVEMVDEKSLEENELKRVKDYLYNWLDIENAPDEELKRILTEQKECLIEDLKKWNIKNKDKLVEKLKIELLSAYVTLAYFISRNKRQ